MLIDGGHGFAWVFLLLFLGFASLGLSLAGLCAAEFCQPARHRAAITCGVLAVGLGILLGGVLANGSKWLAITIGTIASGFGLLAILAGIGRLGTGQRKPSSATPHDPGSSHGRWGDLRLVWPTKPHEGGSCHENRETNGLDFGLSICGSGRPSAISNGLALAKLMADGFSAFSLFQSK